MARDKHHTQQTFFLQFKQKGQDFPPKQQFSSPWWQSSLVGYAASFVFVLGVFLILWLEKFVNVHRYDYFIAIVYVLGTFLIGWIWGTRPALLAIVVVTLCIDYLVIAPIHVFSFYLWPDCLLLLPVVTIQLLFLWLIARHKNTQAQLLRAHQEIANYAEQVSANNQRLEESNEQLAEANRLKDMFLSMASHELRTPVTSIYGHVQLLLQRIKKQSSRNAELLPIRDSLLRVNEQTQRLVGLINDLLDINSLRSGKIPLHLVPCDISHLCRKIVEEQRPLTDRLIDLRLPPEPVIVQADEKRLSQVIVNLLSNALKYSPPATTIRVEITQLPGKVILAVHNEGPALSKEQQKSIFEPFYRSPKAHSSATPGWGLGLAISKEIVRQHSGGLSVESLEGKGTTFSVALPA